MTESKTPPDGFVFSGETLAALQSAGLIDGTVAVGVQLIQQGEPLGSLFMNRVGIMDEGDIQKLRQRAWDALLQFRAQRTAPV